MRSIPGGSCGHVQHFCARSMCKNEVREPYECVAEVSPVGLAAGSTRQDGFSTGNEANSLLAHRLQCINHRVTPSLGMTAAGFSS